MRERGPRFPNNATKPLPQSDPVSSQPADRGHRFSSIVLTGRNDGYGGDFAARFFRTLQFNHEQLTSRGLAHEFVFIEWAPPADRPLLFDEIGRELPNLNRRVCAWYIVHPNAQIALSLNPRLEYLEFLAKNVGVRRARGQYVLTSNCDVSPRTLCP